MINKKTILFLVFSLLSLSAFSEEFIFLYNDTFLTHNHIAKKESDMFNNTLYIIETIENPADTYILSLTIDNELNQVWVDNKPTRGGIVRRGNQIVFMPEEPLIINNNEIQKIAFYLNRTTFKYFLTFKPFVISKGNVDFDKYLHGEEGYERLIYSKEYVYQGTFKYIP